VIKRSVEKGTIQPLWSQSRLTAKKKGVRK